MEHSRQGEQKTAGVEEVSFNLFNELYFWKFARLTTIIILDPLNQK